MGGLRVLTWTVLVIWSLGEVTTLEHEVVGILGGSHFNATRSLQKRELGEIDDSLVAASHHWSHGGGSEHHGDHHSSHGKKADKGYHAGHHHDHGKKGHHDKEGHSGHYSEHGGHKKKHHDEGGYHKVSQQKQSYCST